VTDAAPPARPPFTLRARLITPLAGGGVRHERDALIVVGEEGRIMRVDPWGAPPEGVPSVDLRPMVVLPGLVDLHAHLPQIGMAGLGAGLDLLTWLDRYIFPIERDFDRRRADALAPAAFAAFAAAGTTTVVAYAAVWADSTDACFAAAEAHGIRAVIGKVLMDRITYDERTARSEILETNLREAETLFDTWDGRDRGRLRYAFTPRFALSCSEEMLRQSTRLAREKGAYWQTHLAEDSGEMGEVRRLFPSARDYTDVYDRAGGLGERTILAHAIHLSDREVERLAESGARVAHCPASNLFLSSGTMRLARYLGAGLTVGLGSDVAAGPELSLFSVMRAGAYTQRMLRLNGAQREPYLRPLDWLRLATYEGARVLGMEREIGSIEVGKEADLLLVDPRFTAPLPDDGEDDSAVSGDPAELMSRLIFRPHPAMVRGAWVRGRRLAGPPASG
jgi:guanine deaminase